MAEFSLMSMPSEPQTTSQLIVVVAIPAYNEEKTIAKVILNAQKQADVVIVCDDGSADLTGEIAKRLGAVVVKHEKNLGYGAALQSLFKRARELNADVLITLDSDGQHDPREIPLLVDPIKKGLSDVVLGSRFLDKQGTYSMPKYRKIGIKIITKLTKSSKNQVSDSQSGYRAYSKLALERLISLSENGMSASIELIRIIDKANLRVIEVPITCKYGSTGAETSTKNPLSHGVSLVLSIIKMVIEDKPLQSLGIPGALSLATGIFFGLWVIGTYAEFHVIITNVALATIAFVLIGFFMIFTSITLYAIKRLSDKMNRATN